MAVTISVQRAHMTYGFYWGIYDGEKYSQFKGVVSCVTDDDNKIASKGLNKQIALIYEALYNPYREIGVILIGKKPKKTGAFEYVETESAFVVYGTLLERLVAAHPHGIELTIATCLKYDSNQYIFNAKFGPGLQNSRVHAASSPYPFVPHLGEMTGVSWYLLSETLDVRLRPGCPYFVNTFDIKVSLPEGSLLTRAKSPLELNFMTLNGKILEEAQHTDATIVADSGKEFPCLKVILSNHSDVFKSMFSGGDNLEARTGRVEMKDATAEGVQALLEFLYTFQTKLPENDSHVALELLELGHKYNINSLVDTMEKLFIIWPKGWKDNVGIALRLFVFARNVDDFKKLKEKAIDVLKKLNKKLEKSEDFQLLFEKNLPAAIDLCIAAFAHKG